MKKQALGINNIMLFNKYARLTIVMKERHMIKTQIPIKWVRIKQFCELTGITENAVRKKRQNGKWSETIVKAAKDQMLYVNIEEYQKWIEQS